MGALGARGALGAVRCASATGAVLGVAFALIMSVGSAAVAQGTERLGEVRVHGNHTTPDADVLALAGLAVGSTVTDAELKVAEDKLRKSGRFADVEVRKRFRSIDDPSDILVILLVDEHPGISDDNLMPGPLKRFRGLGMWLPIVDFADGYGFTYGARISFVDALGRGSRISVPATWGGERRIGVTVDRTFATGPFTRVEGAFAVTRRENPRYELGDTRQEGRGRVERAVTPWLRAGGGARVTNVRFGQFDERFVAPGADLTVDTRTDPTFPRNAVHLVSGVERLLLQEQADVTRWQGDFRGYVGLFGSSVVAVRAMLSRVNTALPIYEQVLLGGTSVLRGYDLGYRSGDNLTAVSAELRVPLTSPLNVGRLGVTAFIDAASVAADGVKLSDQRFDRGIGAGVFFTAPAVRLSLDVAWPRGAANTPRTPRVHFGLGVTF
jgi:outer membrane protein assembly factor BamA